MVSKKEYVRPHARELTSRLREPRRFLQVVTGARQVGKTTMVGQVLRHLDWPQHFASADLPTLQGEGWIEAQWDAARLLTTGKGDPSVLVLDEVQKVDHWSEKVKALWDEDTRTGRSLRVVLLGSAPLLVQKGLSESLAGRFEILHLPHWPFSEMQKAFGWDLERFLYHGGYPGPAPLVDDPARWTRYVRDSLIEPTISRDVLLLTRVDKPALLRRLLELGCAHSGQVLSYNKMLGQLQDAGNTVTLAHYLDLLSGAGMLTGLDKYAGGRARRRGSSPKLQVYDTALVSALSGLSPREACEDREFRGRLVESAVGAHLVNAAAAGECEVYYWRERDREVDFVVKAGRRLAAIEVKSGRPKDARSGLDAFARSYPTTRRLIVGTGGIALEDFLSRPVGHWLRE